MQGDADSDASQLVCWLLPLLVSGQQVLMKKAPFSISEVPLLHSAKQKWSMQQWAECDCRLTATQDQVMANVPILGTASKMLKKDQQINFHEEPWRASACSELEHTAHSLRKTWDGTFENS